MAFATATLVLSTAAAALGNHPCSNVVLHNDDASINMLVGNSAAQNFSMGPGQTSGPIKVRNTNQVYVKSASGTPTVSYHWE